jgi:hypothetical protein
MRLRAAVTALIVGVGLFAGATPAVAAEGDVVGAGAPDALAGRYIVVLKQAPTPAEAAALAGLYGGTLKRLYRSALPGFAVRMSAAAARKLAAHPAVSYVQQDQEVSLLGDQASPPSWGLDRIDQTDLPLDTGYHYPSAATGVHAYIIDTGIRTTHTDFGGRATIGFDAVGTTNVNGDCNGHGTHVAGTVGGTQYGVAKDVTLVGVRVLDCDGSGSWDDVIAGIDWVTANAVHPAVANMSLGGSPWPAVETALRASIASGVTYAVAAGNGDSHGNGIDACTFSPARVSEAITVGATDIGDNKAGFSNYGTCLDLFAPGVSIYSATYTADSGGRYLSGTSMATPHVTGAAALILADDPTATPAQVRDTLVGSARYGRIPNAGTGSPNRLLYTGTAAWDPTPPAPPPPPPPPAPQASPAPCWQATNGTDLPIRDRGSVTSAVWIGGCPGRPTKATVEVHVKHPRRGDVVVELVAPNGSVRRLKGASSRDRGADVDAVYTAKVTVKSRNGTWRLRVRDQYKGVTGYVDSWTLTL